MMKSSTSHARIVEIQSAQKMKPIALIAEIPSTTIALMVIVQCQMRIPVVCVQRMCFARIAVRNQPSLSPDLFLLVLLGMNLLPAIRTVIPFLADFPAAPNAEVQIFNRNAGVYWNALCFCLDVFLVHGMGISFL